MRFFDSISLGQTAAVSKTRALRNGMMVADVRAARGGNVQSYLGAEVDKPDMAVVRVYRDADEVFNRDRVKSIAHKTVTIGHPKELVSSKTWKDVAVGHSGEDVMRDGEFVRIPMLLTDQAAIEQVNSGTKELSLGYTCDLDFTAGKTTSGEEYDARQTNIMVDHIAIVSQGRAGPDCRIGDESPSGAMKALRALDQSSQHKEPPPMAIRQVIIDAIPFMLDEQAAAAVGKMQGENARLVADNLKLTGEATTKQTAHDQALAAKDAEIATLKGKQLDDKALQVAAAELAGVMNAAHTIVGDAVKPDGLGVAAIRRETVKVAVGDEYKQAWSDDYVHARFDILAKDANPGDPLVDTFRSGVVSIGDAERGIAKAHEDRNKALRDGWKNPAGKA